MQPDNLVPAMQISKYYLYSFLYKIDCFHNQSTVNICIAGPNRRAGYATDSIV